MSASHTPGPWEAIPASKYDPADKRWYVVVSEEAPVPRPLWNDIGDVFRSWSDEKPEVIEANARLIAAAPDMLEALEKICAGNNMAGRENWSTHDVIQEHYKIAHSAIAKATGKEAA